MSIKNNKHNNSSYNNDNDNTNDNHNKNQLLGKRRKGYQRNWMKLNKPILKKMIIAAHSPLYLPCCPVLNIPEKHLYEWKRDCIVIEKKNYKHGKHCIYNELLSRSG